MPHATSADGTTTGYDRMSDDGPVVVLVGGGLDDGSENVPLGEHLGAAGFAVVNYRRRGRGDSGDTQPYAVEREVEDPAADAAAAILPDARRLTIEVAGHVADPALLAPRLTEFFRG